MTLENVNKKRLVIRVVLLALIVAFGFLLFYIGKQHEVLLDNKEVEIAGYDLFGGEMLGMERKKSRKYCCYLPPLPGF